MTLRTGQYHGFTGRGYRVRIRNATSTIQQGIRDSNSWNPRYHIALHSNAGPSGLACGGTRGGTETYNYTGNVSGSYLAQEILNRLGPRSPGTGDKRIHRTDLYELRASTSTSVYVESGYHDWNPEENWLRTYLSWSYIVPISVDVRLGYPG